MKQIKTFGRDLVHATLIDAAKMIIIPVLITIGTFVASSTILSPVITNPYLYYPSIAFLVLFSFFLSILLYEKLIITRPSYPRIDYDFHVKEFRVELRYLSANSFVYKKSKVVHAVKDNITEYHDKYRWTGDQNVEMSCLDPAFILRMTGRKSVWNTYCIDFQKTLKKGDEANVHLEWLLSDKDHRFVPFISATIEEPCDRLVMRLDAGDVTKNIRRVIVEVSSHLGARAPFETHTLEKPENDVYIWATDSPRFLHHYEMRWVVVE